MDGGCDCTHIKGTEIMVNVRDFKNWCRETKGIHNIMTAPFDIWISCITEYCDIYHRNDYLKALIKGNK